MGYNTSKNPNAECIVPFDWGSLQTSILTRPHPPIREVRLILSPGGGPSSGERIAAIERAVRSGMSELSSQGLLVFGVDEK